MSPTIRRAMRNVATPTGESKRSDSSSALPRSCGSAQARDHGSHPVSTPGRFGTACRLSADPSDSIMYGGVVRGAYATASSASSATAISVTPSSVVPSSVVPVRAGFSNCVRYSSAYRPFAVRSWSWVPRSTMR